MLLRAVIIILLVTVSFPAKGASAPAPASSTPEGCRAERAVSVPAPVDLAQVMRDLYALEDEHQVRVLDQPDAALEGEIRVLFDRAVPRSKLEQFYTMLLYISRHASRVGSRITFDVAKAQALLLSSRVFSDSDFPRHIVGIEADRIDARFPRYRVLFDRPEVRLALNAGQGFGVFREGMCQHAKALVFYGSFSFSLGMEDRHLVVSDFANLDLWGDFGVRGLVDIDLNYVTVRSVEFLKGSNLGLVKAKVSRREFQTNSHSIWLKLLSGLVTDRSVQPIDW